MSADTASALIFYVLWIIWANMRWAFGIGIVEDLFIREMKIKIEFKQ
jgi:hypothetical protein